MAVAVAVGLHQVFNWLVGKINEAHTSAPGGNGEAVVAETVAFVGILDIFGKSGRSIDGFCPSPSFFFLLPACVIHVVTAVVYLFLLCAFSSNQA